MKENVHPLEAVLAEAVAPGSKVESMMPMLFKQRRDDGSVEPESWWRSFAWMQLSGLPLKDCADSLGQTVSYLTLVKHHKEFRVVCDEVAKEHFDGDMWGLLESSAMTSVVVLEELALNAKSETVKATAAGKLLESCLKHRQPARKQSLDDAQKELERLNREIKALEEAERRKAE